MKCPKCEEELTITLPRYQITHNWQDVDLECSNGHSYFVRIKEEDLIEDNAHINKGGE